MDSLASLVISLQYLCFLWISYAHSQALWNENTGSFKLRRDVKIQQHDINLERKLKSDMACLVMCSADPLCDKIAWHDENKMCAIGKVTWENLKRYSSRYEIDIGWIGYETDKYPVALYCGPNGFWSMTFDEAEAWCISMGTTITSPGELIHATRNGYSMCACGWLSRGYAGFSMHSYQAGCSVYLYLAVQSCAVTVTDVYCNV